MSLSVEERLSRLERSVRRWRAGCVAAAAAGIVAIGVGAAAPETPKDLSVRSLRVVNANGATTVLLRNGLQPGDSGMIYATTPDKQTVFVVGSMDGEGHLTLNQPGGKRSVELTASKLCPNVGLNGSNGELVMRLHAEDDEARVTIHGPKDQVVWEAPPQK